MEIMSKHTASNIKSASIRPPLIKGGMATGTAIYNEAQKASIRPPLIKGGMAGKRNNGESPENASIRPPLIKGGMAAGEAADGSHFAQLQLGRP